jgi:hypothetical protein
MKNLYLLLLASLISIDLCAGSAGINATLPVEKTSAGLRDYPGKLPTESWRTLQMTSPKALFVESYNKYSGTGQRGIFVQASAESTFENIRQKSDQQRNLGMFYLASFLVQLLPIVFLRKIGYGRAGMRYVAEVVILFLPVIYLAGLLYLMHS